MAKLYTLDDKLLTGTPEIRISDKLYPVDDRKKTVSKILEISQKDDIKVDEKITEIFKLAFGKKATEVLKITEDMPWIAYQELFLLVMSAATGQDEDEKDKKEDNASSGS